MCKQSYAYAYMAYTYTYSRRKHDVTCLVTLDIVGVGLSSDNNFQPITSFVSNATALLCNEILLGVTFLRYDGKHVTCCLLEYIYPGFLKPTRTGP